MKPRFDSPLHILPLIIALHGHASAADVIKANNTTALNDSSSFTTTPAYDGTEVAVWDSTVTAANTVGLGADLSFAGIRIANPTGLVTLSAGSTLTLGSSGIDMTSAGGPSLTISANNTIGASQSWNIASSRTLTINNTGSTTTFGTGTTTTLSGAGTVEFGNNRVLAGDGALVVDGAVLSNNLQGGTQTRTGPTTLTSGSIKITTGVSLFGSGALNLNGGRIGSGNGSRRIISNNVSVGGDFEVGGTGLSTGAIQLSGPVDFGSASRQVTATSTLELTGTVTNAPALVKLGAGSLVLGVVNASSTSLTLSAGKLLLGGNSGSASIGSLSGVAGTSIDSNYNLLSDGLRSLSVNQTADGTYAGIISNLGGAARAISLTKGGTATLTLSGANTYTGGTTLSQGTIVAVNSSALGGSGTVTINDTSTGSNNATLNIDATAGAVTIARAINVANQGGGTVTLGSSSTSGANNAVFSGAITLAKDVTLNGGTAGDRFSTTGGIGGTGNVTIAGTNRVLFGTAANTYAGNLTVNSGTILQLSDGTATANSQIPDASIVTVNGTLNLAKGANSETIGGLSGSGLVRGHPAVASIASALVVSDGAAQTFSGVLADGGASGATLSLTKSGAGTQTLSGANTYTGTTNINGGTLALGGGGSIGNTPAINIASGAMLDVSVAAFTLGSSQTLTGAGTVTGTVNQGATGGTITPSGGNLSIGSVVYNGDGIVNVTPGSAIVSVTASNGLSTSANNVTVNVQGGPLIAGQYPVIDYSGTIQGSGVGSFVVGTNPGGAFTYSLIDNTTNSSVDLLVTSLADVWSGAFSNEWSTAIIGGSKNWALNAAPVDYANGHDVQFTDAANGTTTVDVSAADVTPASVAFNHSSKNYTLQGSAAIAGSTGLAKAGTGTLTINNVNKFTGSPDITGGTVVVSSMANGGVDSPLGAGTGMALGNATLSYTGATTSTDRALNLTAPGTLEVTAGGSALTLSGLVSGANSLSKTGAGTLVLDSTLNSYSGGTSILGGTLSIDDGAKAGTGTMDISGATLALTGASAITYNKAITLGAGGGTVQVDNTAGAALTGTIGGTTALTKTGSGTLTLGAANTYASGTFISSGRLDIGTANSASAGTGSIDIASGATLGLTWSTTGVIVLSNNLTGTGTVVQAGASQSTLTGSNTFSGTYQINAATLAFRALSSAAGQPKVAIAAGANLALGNDFAGQTCTISELSGDGGVNPQFDAASGTKTLEINQTTNTTFSGVMRDATTGSRFLAVAKSGPGTLTLSGANTYTGNTTVNAGTLELVDNAQLKFVLGATSGTNNAISGGGTAILDGDFVIVTTAADALATGTWTVENVSSLTGAYGSTFSVVGFTDIGNNKWTKPNGLTKLYTFDETTGILTLGPAGYSAWAGANGTTQTIDQDHDNDGVSNGVEFFIGGPNNTTGFTPLPGINGTSVTFTKHSGYTGVYGTDFAIETSETLIGAWTQETVGGNVGQSGDSFTYTFPAGPAKNFARLKVTGP